MLLHNVLLHVHVCWSWFHIVSFRRFLVYIFFFHQWSLIRSICFLQLHLMVTYAIMISALLGFGLCMSLNTLYLQYMARRYEVPQSPNLVWLDFEEKQDIPICAGQQGRALYQCTIHESLMWKLSSWKAVSRECWIQFNVIRLSSAISSTDDKHMAQVQGCLVQDM